MTCVALARSLDAAAFFKARNSRLHAVIFFTDVGDGQMREQFAQDASDFWRSSLP